MSTLTQASTYQRILDSLAAPAPRDYTPQFHIAPERWGWTIFDGDVSIARFTLDGDYAFDIWKFSPFDPPIMANSEPAGAVYDLHTAHNTFVNFPVSRCGDIAEGVENVGDCMEAEWLPRSGAELHLRITGKFLEGQHIQYDVRVFYDPQRVQYRFFFDAEAWKIRSTGGEPINMMLAGALTDTAEKRRWTHSLWADPQDQVKRLMHSNALFNATDYGDSTGRWRTKNAPLTGAWIAYAAHPEFNPAMLIREANAPIQFATCSQLFDEHLIWQSAGLDELDEGYFHFVMRTEFVNLPAALAQEFLAGAMDPPRPARWRTKLIALPFHMGVENSFETSADPWEPEDCPIIVLEDMACWADDAAHSGSRSLKLTGEAFHHWKTLMPVGAVCSVQPNSRYRLSGWIKTEGVERFARLELASYEYTYNNIIDITHSAHVAGDTDWTYVETDLDTGDEAYVMPRLSLYARGTAWFDDVKLEKVGE
ncbi:MAG: hypothetical protein L6437_02995 [Kiritimatiellae bacterium]|nr:hypothetical protein [Verrucomicrobiota bacterium]MCG2659197.1 hypothetical protein [Kiritimatiellia bacterium]